MIDLLKAKQYYKEYIKQYNPEVPRIALKISHIYRTAEQAKWIAEKLSLNKEDIELAELIGLLHDIGRFEQVKKFNTFIDKESINHGEYGVKVLFEDNLIRNFIGDKKYDNIIKAAIINHNRDQIDPTIKDERTLMHCKIIRDADKLDIYKVILLEDLKETYPLEKWAKEPVSKEIKKDFIEFHKINYSNRKTCADTLISHIAYIFDINYIYSLQKIKQEEYLKKVVSKFGARENKTISDINECLIIAEEYMNEELKKYIIK